VLDLKPPVTGSKVRERDIRLFNARLRPVEAGFINKSVKQTTTIPSKMSTG